MSASPRVRASVLAVPALAALLGVAACSSGSSASSVSSTTPSTSPTTSPATSPAVGGSATDSAGAVASSGASLASSASGQAAAIAQCLQAANLPTPTSSDPVGAAAEVAKLVTNPATRAALQKCGIPLPGLASASS